MSFPLYLSVLAHYSDELNKAVAKATLTDGTLPDRILNLEGMSSWANRILLNEICKKIKNTSYLEIGSWRGSTFISALYNNKHLVKATSIDSHEEYINHDTFKTTADMLKANCERELVNGEKYELVTADCFKYTLPSDKKYNVYLFDGPHAYEDQYRAITHYYNNLEPIFIYICDDFCCTGVEDATRKAFQDMNIEVIAEHKMFGFQAFGDHMQKGFWNGYYAAVCVKRDDFPQFFKKRENGSYWGAHRFSDTF